MDGSKVYRHVARAYTGEKPSRDPSTRHAYRVMGPRLDAMLARAKLTGSAEEGELKCVARPVNRLFADGFVAPALQVTWYAGGERINRTNLLLRYGVLR